MMRTAGSRSYSRRARAPSPAELRRTGRQCAMAGCPRCATWAILEAEDGTDPQFFGHCSRHKREVLVYAENGMSDNPDPEIRTPKWFTLFLPLASGGVQVQAEGAQRPKAAEAHSRSEAEASWQVQRVWSHPHKLRT